MPEALQQWVGHLLALRQHAAHSEQEWLRGLRKMAHGEPYAKVVQTWTKKVVGIGWLSAIRMLLELGDVERFPRRGSLPHYLGLTPSEYSTGDEVHRGGVLRCGPARVRSWLIESVWIAVRREPQLKALFCRIQPKEETTTTEVGTAQKSWAY